jgi:uridine kinase
MHYVVGVAGPVGGGKTSLVSGITRILGNATVIHMDDYEEYTTQPVGEVLELLKSGADYDVLKMGNLAKDLQSLKFGREVFSPTTQFPVCPSKYIIFETQFGREHRATGQWIDLLLWIDLPLDIALARKLKQFTADVSGNDRDARLSFVQFLDEYLESYLLAVGELLEMQKRTVRVNADAIINGRASKEEIIATAVELIHQRLP